MDTKEATTHQAALGTTPPRRPTAEDIALLTFAQKVEMTVRDLYDEAIDAKVFSDATVAETVITIREAHEAYSQSLSGLLGRVAPNTRDDTIFDELKQGFTGDAASAAAAAADLENVAVATHTDLLGQLVGTDGATLVASILVVEARFATVLRALSGATSLTDQLNSQGKALVPSTNQ